MQSTGATCRPMMRSQYDGPCHETLPTYCADGEVRPLFTARTYTELILNPPVFLARYSRLYAI